MNAASERAQAAAEQLDAHGYVVLEDVLPTARVEELRAVSERLYAASPQARGAEPLHSLTAFRDDAGLGALLTCPPVIEVVRAVLGESVSVYHSHLDMHPPHGHRTYHWHQDIDLITRDCGRLRAPLCLKAGFFLTDVPSDEHGAMRVQPRTHAGEPFDPNSNGIPVTVRAGSVVVFDHRVWHTRGLNTSAVTRAAFFVAYAYRWIRRRDELADLPDGSADLARAVRRLLDVIPPELPARPDGTRPNARGPARVHP